jgi:serine/threonine protein kinase
MGVVYEIEHVRLKKRYVAKVINESIANDAGALKRMEREAQVLAELNHPNVVQVHDVGTTSGGVHYFVMEKLEGVDLRKFMQSGPVPAATALRIIVDVLDALDYVHRRGVVHRDIKPENIFLSEQPQGTQTKVLDFGVVHIFDRDGRLSQARITKTGGFAGTLYYASPEQMQGKPPGPPNDVYAAGLVLFELLAGKGPFDDDPGVGLSRCFKPAPRLADQMSIAPTISEAAARALEQEPLARPTAGALAAELRKILAAPGVVAPRAGDAPANFKDSIGKEVDDLLRHMPVERVGGPTPDAAPLAGARVLTGANVKVAATMASAAPAQSAASNAPPVLFATSAGLGGYAPAPRATPTPNILDASPMPVRPENTAPGVYSTVDGAHPTAPVVPVKSWGSAPTTPWRRLRRLLSKSAAPLIAAAVVGFMVLVGVVGGLLVYRRSTESAAKSSVSTAVTAAPTAPPAVDAGLPTAVAEEPAASASPAPPASAASAAQVPSPSPGLAPKAHARTVAPVVRDVPPPPGTKPKPATSAKDSKDGYLREL